MTEKWEGFTQEEISNIVNEVYVINTDTVQSNSPVKKMTFKQNKFGKKNITRERMLKSSKKHHLSSGENTSGLPQGARLSISKIPEEDEIEEMITAPEVDKIISASLPPSLSTFSNEAEATNEPVAINEPCNTSYLDSSVDVFSPNEASLDKFEKRQKMIKEQNRQKKELLKKALEDRTKKTHEEARRLSQIDDELKKLDIQLSSDVSILRNQIEVASLEFMEAQKRFDHAEKEYLDAKLALFTKRERKELLTGHLCTIIEQNELRKAKKLSDLMDKLQLGSIIMEKPLLSSTVTINNEEKETKMGTVSPGESQAPT